MRGIKRYFKSTGNGGYSAKRSKGNTITLSNGYGRGSRTVAPRSRRSRRSFKPRGAFGSIRRHRGRRGTRKSGRLTIAKIVKALTPRCTASYACAGKVFVGASAASGPSCVYYFPNIRNGVSDTTAVTPSTVGLGARIINGSGQTQVFPSYADMAQIGTRISSVDGNSQVLSASFFTPSVKFWAGNYKAVTKMVNQSNGQAVVTVYTCIARRDVPTALNSLYSLLYSGYYEKMTSADNGNSYTSQTGDDVMRDDQLEPYDSSKFCSYFIVSQRRMIMNAGDIKVVTHGKRGMQVINPAVYSTLNSGTATWSSSTADVLCRKGAVFQFFKVSGQPTNDTTNKAAIGLSSPAIVFTHDYTFTYRFMVEAGAVNTRLGNTGFGAVTNASIMGEQSDTVQTGVNA